MMHIALPDGFQPESVTVAGSLAYFGSLADGSILAVDLRDGSKQLVSPACGVPAGGLRLDGRGRLFVTGGFSGTARVVDAAGGEIIASYRLSGQPSLVADVLLTPTAAWFTDAFNPVLYRLALGPEGELPGEGGIERLALGGDLVYGQGFNVLGIERTPDGTGILIAHCDAGQLFKVDTESGHAGAVPIDGGTIAGADGLFVSGSTLYAALGGKNAVAVVELDGMASRGRLIRKITNAGFDVPTAAVVHGDRLYVVNSRLGTTEATPQTEYTVTCLPL